MHLILNEPQADQERLEQPAELHLPINKNQSSMFLPLAEIPLPTNQPPSPTRHPTFLLNNFPHRPHYYQPDSVGAQAGYCLSPVPPCLRQFTNSASSSAAHQLPSSRTRALRDTSTGSSHFLVSSAALSSLPSLSTTAASSSSSSSDSPPFSSTKPSQSNPHLRINTLEKHRFSQESKPTQSRSTCNGGPTEGPPPLGMMFTKKVLPTPPSLSPRVRKIFMDKIGSQQAQSCAQLPRRKKKTPTVAPAPL